MKIFVTGALRSNAPITSVHTVIPGWLQWLNPMWERRTSGGMGDLVGWSLRGFLEQTRQRQRSPMSRRRSSQRWSGVSCFPHGYPCLSALGIAGCSRRLRAMSDLVLGLSERRRFRSLRFGRTPAVTLTHVSDEIRFHREMISPLMALSLPVYFPRYDILPSLARCCGAASQLASQL